MATTLERTTGFGGAVLLGLGSILGTGVFVSLGLAAGIAGPSVLLGTVLAALLAAANGLSSAQLAANHPVSGGTYEYGYRYLSPLLGFTAGWTFLIAKSASAATAALGFAGYLKNTFGPALPVPLVAVAEAAVIVLTLVVLGGLRRSSHLNAALVGIAMLSLTAFVLCGLPAAAERWQGSFFPFFASPSGEPPLRALFHATALLFVAYTGYGRIATLGEEVRAPRRVIPRAILVTLLVTMVLYVLVTTVALAVAGAPAFARATRGEAAPLEIVARSFGGFAQPWVPWLVGIGATVAMLGVSLNLLLGLSRVLLAMGRRRDVPALFARIDSRGRTPGPAVVGVAALIAGIVWVGDVGATWSLSAFTVLVYYALTNLAALRLSGRERLFPRWIAVAGLTGCLFLAFWVEREIWLTGLALVVAGWLWFLVAARRRGRPEAG